MVSLTHKQLEVAKWRKDNSLFNLLSKKIALKQVVPICDVLNYLEEGNKITRKTIDKWNNNPNHDKITQISGKYDVGAKECTDARSVFCDLYSSLRLSIVSERTAGNIVISGHVFSNVKDNGCKIVFGHSKCGAVTAAYEYHNGKMKKNDLTPELLRILTSIHPSIAKKEDDYSRVRDNAIMQATAARLKLNDKNILPALILWEPEPNIEWIFDSDFYPCPIFDRVKLTLEYGVKSLFNYALAEERTFDTQYSHTIFVYDPYRLGRLNDPRVIFGLLPNEAFCVTFDFDRILNNSSSKELSRTAVASVEYAGFDHGGHVLGVGKRDGNHHIFILDREERVLEKVNSILLENNLIYPWSRGGETITLAKYNPENYSFELINK